MTEDDLFDLITPALRELGSSPDVGEEFRRPPLDVLRYYARRVRLHRVPLLGRAASVVAVVRQPADVGLGAGGYPTLIGRLAMAVNGRYPPWPHGPTIALSAVVLTPEPIGPDEDAALQRALAPPRRSRAFPIGLFRVNLGQEALSFAGRRGPDDLLPEPGVLADALTPHLRRYLNPLEL